jgi:hypothetical protein
VADVRSQWGKVQKIAKRHHPSLPALLEHASPRDVRGDTLILGVKVDFFKKKLDTPEARAALESALDEALEVPLRVKVVKEKETGQHDQAVDDLLAQDDVLAFGVSELGGEITDLDE